MRWTGTVCYKFKTVYAYLLFSGLMFYLCGALEKTHAKSTTIVSRKSQVNALPFYFRIGLRRTPR